MFRPPFAGGIKVGVLPPCPAASDRCQVRCHLTPSRTQPAEFAGPEGDRVHPQSSNINNRKSRMIEMTWDIKHEQTEMRMGIYLNLYMRMGLG